MKILAQDKQNKKNFKFDAGPAFTNSKQKNLDLFIGVCEVGNSMLRKNTTGYKMNWTQFGLLPVVHKCMIGLEAIMYEKTSLGKELVYWKLAYVCLPPLKMATSLSFRYRAAMKLIKMFRDEQEVYDTAHPTGDFKYSTDCFYYPSVKETNDQKILTDVALAAFPDGRFFLQRIHKNSSTNEISDANSCADAIIQALISYMPKFFAKVTTVNVSLVRVEGVENAFLDTYFFVLRFLRASLRNLIRQLTPNGTSGPIVKREGATRSYSLPIEEDEDED